MDNITHEFHAFLLAVNTNPTLVTEKLKHFLEHLFSILPSNESDAIMHYYGILGHRQMSLSEIALENGKSEEESLEDINNNIRRIAISPEWQQLRDITIASIKSNNNTFHHIHKTNDRTVN